MASHSIDAEAASRTSISPARHPAAASTAEPGSSSIQKRSEAVQLSAADCSIADDTGAVSYSVALGAGSASASAEHVISSSQEQQQPPPPLPPPPPPPFEPLFALLTNGTTGATVHPRIHYIFSDDDVSIPTDTDHHHHDGGGGGGDDDGHRRLVVDLEPTPANDAWAVSCASSLGPSFAVTAAELSKQQSDNIVGGDEQSSPGNGAALMLHVEGVSRDPVDLRASEAIGSGSLPSSGSGSGAMAREDLEALADDFRRRMGVLKKVVGEGEKRRAVIARQHEDDAAAEQSHEIYDPGALRSGAGSQSQDAAAPVST